MTGKTSHWVSLMMISAMEECLQTVGLTDERKWSFEHGVVEISVGARLKVGGADDRQAVALGWMKW